MPEETSISPIRGVVLDFGGVMTEPLFQEIDLGDAELGDVMRFFLDELSGVYHLPTGTHELHRVEVGEISEAEFFELICRRYQEAGHPAIDPRRTHEHVYGRALVACGAMVDAVRQLRQVGFRTAMLTNISRDPTTGYRAIVPVDELFDAVVDSSQVGLRKPDPAIYRMVCRRIGLMPPQCLYVDDLQCNVDGARAVGMHAVHCLDPVATAEDLLSRLTGGRITSSMAAG